MANLGEHRARTQPRVAQHGQQPGVRELARLADVAEAQWQDWSRNSGAGEADCLRLIEIAYAVSDLHMQAREMRLELLSHLLGMALQETLMMLRCVEASPYPEPPAR